MKKEEYIIKSYDTLVTFLKNLPPEDAIKFEVAGSIAITAVFYAIDVVKGLCNKAIENGYNVTVLKNDKYTLLELSKTTS